MRSMTALSIDGGVAHKETQFVAWSNSGPITVVEHRGPERRGDRKYFIRRVLIDCLLENVCAVRISIRESRKFAILTASDSLLEPEYWSPRAQAGSGDSAQDNIKTARETILPNVLI